MIISHTMKRCARNALLTNYKHHQTVLTRSLKSSTPASSSILSSIFSIFHIDPSMPSTNLLYSNNNEVDGKNLLHSFITHCDKEYKGLSSCEFDAKAHTFKGVLSYSEENNPAAKGGFCALKSSTLSVPIDLRDYQGFELNVKSKHNQVYTFNAYFQSYFEGDLYQIVLDLPAGKWSKFNIPFSLLILTANGVEREQQRENDSLQLEAIGFLLNTNIDESCIDFELEIGEIKAITNIDDKLLYRQRYSR